MSGSQEPKSVSMIIKQRQQSRSAGLAPKEQASKGRGSGGGAGNMNENLNPVLPPLYPTGPKCTPLTPEILADVQVYSQFANFLRSNFSVPADKKMKRGFYVERYTDQYQAPLTLKSHLLQSLPDSRYPDELTAKKVVRKSVKPLKRRIEDLHEDEKEGSQSPKKSGNPGEPEEEKEEKDEEVNLDDEEVEDDPDEEMDAGTDYFNSYFDNGEGEDDDLNDDDGPTY